MIRFDARFDMLQNAILLCTGELWDNEKRFWHNAFHCQFYLDYYLTVEPTPFLPPPPYTRSGLDPSGEIRESVSRKKQLFTYLQHSRTKCRDLIARKTIDFANSWRVNKSQDYSVIKILPYNMRHVQHHTVQFNLLLRPRINNAPRWVSQTKENLNLKRATNNP